MFNNIVGSSSAVVLTKEHFKLLKFIESSPYNFFSVSSSSSIGISSILLNFATTSSPLFAEFGLSICEYSKIFSE